MALLHQQEGGGCAIGGMVMIVCASVSGCVILNKQKKIPGDNYMQEISWNDFEKVELRVGKILQAEVFEEARKPAYKLLIDFGEKIGVRKSSAQITEHYSPDELIGRLVVGVVNFPKKQIGPFMSECLTTGFYDAENSVVLCTPDKAVPLGAKLL